MSNFEVIEGSRVPIKAWTRGVEVADNAKEQLRRIASLPFVFRHVAAMPDVHLGIGATVGSVVATRKAIVPAAVGVDIGCGMAAIKTTLTASDLPDSLADLRREIESSVPHGRTDNGGSNDRGAWRDVPKTVALSWIGLADDFWNISAKYPEAFGRWDARAPCHLGTLGTGNHFIEVCLDEDQGVWIMLHSGSRGVGNRIGSYFIQRAKEEMERWHIELDDKDLSYLPEGTTLFDDYFEAVGWAQRYAAINREIMMNSVVNAISTALRRQIIPNDYKPETAVNCHHNYVARERHFGENVMVTRKGAVNASEGTYGIIPGSMGAKSFIVRGKGDRDSFHSCSHGAGRRHSRGEAKRLFTVEDHVKATDGVECKKDQSVLDETPAAYKDIDAVMAAQSDLVDIVYTLKQVLCVKG